MGLTTSAATLALVCAGMELALRALWDRPNGHLIRFEYWKYLQPDPELGYIPRPNIRVEYPRYGASFATNSLGLRGRDHPIARQPGLRRVVVLGDSMAFGHGVSDNNAFAEVLEQSLPNTEVINLGVPGFNLRTELRYFLRVGVPYQPDVVLLALCQNDIHDLDAAPYPPAPATAAREAKAPACPERDEPGLLRPLKQRLSRHCFLYAFCQNAVNSNKRLAKAAVQIGLKEELAGFEMLDDNLHASLVDYPPTVRRAMDQLRRDLLEIHTQTVSHGARLLVALVPALQAVDDQALMRSIAYTRYEPDDFDTDKPYQLITRFTAEHGIRVVNPLPDFQAAHDRGAELYLPEDMHLSGEGHRLFAETIRPVLAAMLDEVSPTDGPAPRGAP